MYLGNERWDRALRSPGVHDGSVALSVVQEDIVSACFGLFWVDGTKCPNHIGGPGNFLFIIPDSEAPLPCWGVES